MDEDEILDQLPPHLRNKALEALSEKEGLTEEPEETTLRPSPTVLWWLAFSITICWAGALTVVAIPLLLVFPPLGAILAFIGAAPAVALLHYLTTRKDNGNG